MNQHNVDTAWEQRGIDGEPLEQVMRPDVGTQSCGAVDAGTAQFKESALRRALDRKSVV